MDNWRVAVPSLGDADHNIAWIPAWLSISLVLHNVKELESSTTRLQSKSLSRRTRSGDYRSHLDD